MVVGGAWVVAAGDDREWWLVVGGGPKCHGPGGGVPRRTEEPGWRTTEEGQGASNISTQG